MGDVVSLPLSEYAYTCRRCGSRVHQLGHVDVDRRVCVACQIEALGVRVTDRSKTLAELTVTAEWFDDGA